MICIDESAMDYVTEQILASLKDARVRKGYSQRELSARSGVPQSHISKIESGGVDLRLSSLIAIARVLDLEVLVAPKKSVPAINAVIKSAQGYQDTEAPVPPAYSLSGDADE